MGVKRRHALVLIATVGVLALPAQAGAFTHAQQDAKIRTLIRQVGTLKSKVRTLQGKVTTLQGDTGFLFAFSSCAFGIQQDADKFTWDTLNAEPNTIYLYPTIGAGDTSACALLKTTVNARPSAARLNQGSSVRSMLSERALLLAHRVVVR